MALSWPELHGALTHFPVALFLVSAFFEIAAFVTKHEDWRKTSYLLLLVGVVMAIPTLFSGWMTAGLLFGGIATPPHIFLLHRALAFATSMLALLLLIVRGTTHDKPSISVFSIVCSFLIAVMIGGVGFLGERMVFSGVSSQEIFPSTPAITAPWKLSTQSNSQALTKEALGIMKASGCFGCHSMNGSGGISGPNLTHEGQRHPDVTWQIKHLKDPSSVSPGSFMPSFSGMPTDQLNKLAQFLAHKK